MQEPVVVIGAGLAGLACARILREAGLPVQLLEASGRIGGRVGSDRVEGFIVDRGFQVLFPSYPSLRRFPMLRSLDLQAFDRGAHIALAGGRGITVADPRQEPWTLFPMMASRLFHPADLPAMLRWTMEALGPGERNPYPDSLTAHQLVERSGVSAAVVQGFLRPFFGGIFLDPALDVPANDFLYYWGHLARQGAALPAKGMQAIPDALAGNDLVPRLGAEVVAVEPAEGERWRVRTHDGEACLAAAVVAATHPQALPRLLPGAPNLASRHAVSLHFSSIAPPIQGRKIWLNGTGNGLINLACVLTQVVPGYAPPGSHQTVVQLLSDPGVSDEALFTQVRAELAQAWNIPETALRPLAIQRTRHAQTEALANRLPSEPSPGFFVATDAQVRSSIDGALTAGIQAAERVIAHLSRIGHS